MLFAIVVNNEHGGGKRALNYEMIMDYLKEWNDDESFYREVYIRKTEGESLEPLYRRKDIDPEVREWALDPESIDPYKTEETFFVKGRNVTLVKHPRYLPFFTHRHAFFEMLYVLSGHCREVTNDRRVDLKEGDLCILAPNVTHGIEVFDDSIILNILIRYSTFMDIFYNIVRDKSQIAGFFLGNLYEKNKTRYLLYHTSEDEVIRNYILDMYMEQMHPDDYSDRIICSLLTIFFTQLTRRHGRTVEIPERPHRRTEYDDEMLNYIIQNYAQVTLRDVAAHFHFSEPYCSRIITDITGIPFSDLVTRIRLQNGENLLAHTQMSVADISDRIGYKNPETFIRSFSRNYHMTPSQYRKSINSI